MIAPYNSFWLGVWRSYFVGRRNGTCKNRLHTSAPRSNIISIRVHLNTFMSDWEGAGPLPHRRLYSRSRSNFDHLQQTSKRRYCMVAFVPSRHRRHLGAEGSSMAAVLLKLEGKDRWSRPPTQPCAQRPTISRPSATSNPRSVLSTV